MKKPAEDPNKSLRQLFTTLLAVPAIICAIIGLIFLLSDPTHGLILIGLAVGLGGVNFLILRAVLQRLDNADESQDGPLP